METPRKRRLKGRKRLIDVIEELCLNPNILHLEVIWTEERQFKTKTHGVRCSNGGENSGVVIVQIKQQVFKSLNGAPCRLGRNTS